MADTGLSFSVSEVSNLLKEASALPTAMLYNKEAGKTNIACAVYLLVDRLSKDACLELKKKENLEHIRETCGSHVRTVLGLAINEKLCRDRYKTKPIEKSVTHSEKTKIRPKDLWQEFESIKNMGHDTGKMKDTVEKEKNSPTTGKESAAQSDQPLSVSDLEMLNMQVHRARNEARNMGNSLKAPQNKSMRSNRRQGNSLI